MLGAFAAAFLTHDFARTAPESGHPRRGFKKNLLILPDLFSCFNRYCLLRHLAREKTHLAPRGGVVGWDYDITARGGL